MTCLCKAPRLPQATAHCDFHAKYQLEFHASPLLLKERLKMNQHFLARECIRRSPQAEIQKNIALL